MKRTAMHPTLVVGLVLGISTAAWATPGPASSASQPASVDMATCLNGDKPAKENKACCRKIKDRVDRDRCLLAARDWHDKAWTSITQCLWDKDKKEAKSYSDAMACCKSNRDPARCREVVGVSVQGTNTEAPTIPTTEDRVQRDTELRRLGRFTGHIGSLRNDVDVLMYKMSRILSGVRDGDKLLGELTKLLSNPKFRALLFNLPAEIDKIKAEIEAAKRIGIENKGLLEKLQQEMIRQAGELADLKAALADVQKDIEALKERVKLVELAVADQGPRIDALEGQVKSLRWHFRLTANAWTTRQSFGAGGAASVEIPLADRWAVSVTGGIGRGSEALSYFGMLTGDYVLDNAREWRLRFGGAVVIDNSSTLERDANYQDFALTIGASWTRSRFYATLNVGPAWELAKNRDDKPSVVGVAGLGIRF